MGTIRTQIEAQLAALFNEHHKFLIVDTETTGLLKDDDGQLVEIACIDQDGQVIYRSLIKPDIAMPLKATQVNGLTDLILAGQPTFAEVWPELSALLCEYTIIYAYNAAYDRGMVLKTATRFKLDVPTKLRRQQWHCMMEIYAKYHGERGLYGDYKWQSLSKACRELKVTMSEVHRSTGDALSTLALMRALAARAGVEEQRV
jgi:DNA polymerase III epsilon subunit-like protein